MIQITYQTSGKSVRSQTGIHMTTARELLFLTYARLIVILIVLPLISIEDNFIIRILVPPATTVSCFSLRTRQSSCSSKLDSVESLAFLFFFFLGSLCDVE